MICQVGPERPSKAVPVQLYGIYLNLPRRAGASQSHTPYIRVKTVIGRASVPAEMRCPHILPRLRSRVRGMPLPAADRRGEHWVVIRTINVTGQSIHLRPTYRLRAMAVSRGGELSKH
jgi:hypothetical protein